MEKARCTGVQVRFAAKRVAPVPPVWITSAPEEGTGAS